MKVLFKILFVISLCLPFAASAQWTDYGTYMNTNDNVGIGTINPKSKLDIGTNYSDPSTYPNKITLWSGGTNNYFGFGISSGDLDYFSQNNHRFYTGYNGTPGSEKMVIKSNGNVGIGTTTPASTLSVGGDGNSRYASYFYKTANTNGDAALYAQMPRPTSGSGWFNPVAGVIESGTGYARGVFGSSYNSTPHNSGRSYGVYAQAGNATNRANFGVFAHLRGQNSGAAVLGWDGVAEPGWSTLLPTNDSWAGFFIGDVHASGNVGIGITAPAEKLHINGAVRGNQDGAVRISTGNGYVDIGPKNEGWSHFYTDRPKYYFDKEIRVNSGLIGSYDENLSLRTQGTTHMTILKSNGNVGVGTGSPSTKFDVNGRATCGISFTVGQHDDSYRGLVVDNGPSSAWKLMELKNVLGTKMIVLGNGNVGIGTTTPDNKLDVCGTIRSKEIKVESGWCDYVFYNDYQLPTLEEEEKHIEANGHLLGFESEEAMEGMIHLGDVSRRQQAKIEEIMLHLIELKKENDVLRQEVKTLKKQ